MKKVISILLLLAVMVLGGLLLISKLVEGSHLLSNEALERGGRPILEDEYLDTEVIVLDQEVYMPFEGVKKYIDSSLDIDTENKRLFLSPQEGSFSFEDQAVDSFVKEESIQLNFNLKEISNQLYVPIKSLEKLLGIEVSLGVDSGIVMIDWVNNSHSQGEIIRETHLLESPGWLGKRKLPLDSGTEVKLYDLGKNHYFVRTGEGYLGYVPKAHLQVKSDQREQAGYTFSKKAADMPADKIGLVWDYVNQYSQDRSNEEKLSAVDILTPTWFKLLDEQGTVENKGDFNYIENAKVKGYQVWGLVTNSFDPDLTSSFLADEAAQGNFIRQILFYSGLYELDGINIDFENIHYQDQRALTAFVQRLTEVLHQNNLVVSIDVTIPSSSLNWSKVYDRVALAEIVDYVAVMTYDEHWASSPQSGSVASIGWVERGIQRTLESVPPEKLLLGLPFYTRLWEEETLSNGTIKVSSKAYGMEKMKEILTENNAEILWDQEAGQYYSEYRADSKLYRVWLEDSRSLALKTSLVEKYGLVGVAAWRKDFEAEIVWEAIDQVLKRGQSYEAVAGKLTPIF